MAAEEINSFALAPESALADLPQGHWVRGEWVVADSGNRAWVQTTDEPFQYERYGNEQSHVSECYALVRLDPEWSVVR